MGWLTAQQGVAIFEAGSKEEVLGMVQPFFPYYHQEISEIAPWEKSIQAMLESARRAAAR